jgi:hypothetical protein
MHDTSVHDQNKLAHTQVNYNSKLNIYKMNINKMCGIIIIVINKNMFNYRNRYAHTVLY